jgi:hypothetical protein
MPELEANSVLMLLVTCVALLVLALALIFRISARVHRIESLLGQQSGRSEPAESSPSISETSPGGAFEMFLSEDPSRRTLTKGEQFSAYRKWRQEKGMNWSNS